MKIIKRSKLLHLVNKLNRLFISFGLQRCNRRLKLAIKMVEKCLRWTTCEGVSGLKRFKTYSHCFVWSLMGISVPIHFSSRHKRDLYKITQLSRKSNLDRVFWISVMSCHRLFKMDVDYDTTTVTSSFKGSLWLLLKHLRQLYRVTLSFRSLVDQNWSAKWKWHISGASGPNGPIAYTRYLDDLYAIRSEWLYLKIGLFLYSLPLSNKDETFISLRDTIIQSWTENHDKQFIHSRLAFLSDKSGKTRVVALIDILSQSCLKLVHQRCNRILRRLSETDGTFDQDKQREKIKKWTNDRKTVLSSIDLSAATDRLPVLYQVLVLVWTRILTPLQALGWLLVTTKRTFVFNEGGVQKYVRYKVGQPMGALSSWPVMAISHHVLVWWAYKLAYPHRNPKHFRDYSILGDDLVIRDRAVSEKYLLIISALGVDVSMEKSIVHPAAAEFAKSLFLRGNDLTPFPLLPLNFEKNTFCSNVQVILGECSKRKLRTTLATIVGISPTRWRNLAILTALSPLSPTSVLDIPSRKDHGVFLSFLLIERIKYFSRFSTVRDSTHAFAINDPGKSGKANSSPFLQIALDNGERYPVRRLGDRKLLLTPIPLLGKGWISYCSKAWPDGLPSLDDKNLVPGPTWKREYDDPIVRSSLLMLDKFLPNYFFTRCVGVQVGD